MIYFNLTHFNLLHRCSNKNRARQVGLLWVGWTNSPDPRLLVFFL